MQNKSYYRFIVALLMIWPLFTGCYSWLAAPDIALHEGLEPRYFEELIDKGALGPNFNYKQAENSDLNIKNLYPKDKPAELVGGKALALGKNETGNILVDEKALELGAKAEVLLRFVWLSDVHMRQREIKLGSRKFAHMLDEIIPVTEFNKVQEDFHWAVYYSQIAAINDLRRKHRVDFMIHTGDAVDTGSIEELYQFIYITNKLEIPWLNVVGNHDVTILGNYMARLGYGHDPAVTFYPVGNLGDFIWMHRDKPEISGYGRHLLPVPKNGKHEASMSPGPDKKLAPTTHHGFDLRFNEIECDNKKYDEAVCDYKKYDKAGDYATDLKVDSDGIRVRLIALNSAKKDGLWADGSIDDKQLRWLKEKILPESGDINLVFLHHRPKYFTYYETNRLLANHGDGTLVAFTGHTHEFHLEWHAGQNGRGFYEMNTGSVLVFPQIGRVIELRRTPEGRLWLVSRALWSSLMTVHEQDKDMESETERKKIIAECIATKETKPEDREAMQRNLTKSVRCGHFGAYDDYLADRGKWRFWGLPQPFEEIWKEANVIIEIKPHKPGE
jgi:predicted phosphodiesterase